MHFYRDKRNIFSVLSPNGAVAVKHKIIGSTSSACLYKKEAV